MSHPSWLRLKTPETLNTPALLVFPERIQSNIERMLAAVDAPSRLMPHHKTSRMAEVAQMLARNGIHQANCATLPEAEMLASTGIPSVLIAYPLVGPSIQRLIQLQGDFPGTNFGVLVDSEVGADELASAFRHRARRIDVWFDINSGMNRTGINLGSDTSGILTRIAANSGLNCRGFHVYDGHIRHLDPAERFTHLSSALERVKGAKRLLQGAVQTTLELTVGGTPGFPLYAKDHSLICSPGHALLWDWGYATNFPDLNFDYAAAVAARIVSRPASDLITIDLGYKSLGSHNPIDKRVTFPHVPSATVVLHNEEHMVLRVENPERHSIGEVILGVPYHIGGTVNLYDTAAAVGLDGEIRERWQVHRGK